MNRHYKMFKKGKNWCYVAVATIAVLFGMATNSRVVKADISNNISPSLAQQVETDKVNSINKSEELQKTTENNNQSENLIAVMPKTEENSQLNGWQKQNDMTYYYNEGQKATGVQSINGSQYYFNNEGQLQKNYFLTKDNHTYYFQNDGTRLNDGFYKNWGHTYYFQADGARLDNGFYKNWGHTYYFQGDGSRLDNNFYKNWGHTYYFGNDGARWDNKFMNVWGHTYYFQADGARLDNGFYKNWGHTYYFQGDGSRLDNNFYKNWGHTYYFGNDGARWDNRIYSNWGRNYYFGNDGALLVNNFAMINGNDYYANNQGVLSSVRYQSQLAPIMALEGCTVAALQMLVSVKNINIPLSYAYNHLPQIGGAFNSAGFVGIIPAKDLVNYGRQWDSGLKDISGSSLGDLYNWVTSGHPVIYYGFSAWETAYQNRNHAKVILGINNGKFHVYDSCYPSIYSKPGSFGSGPYGHGADSYLTWNQVASEYNGSGAITTL